MQSKTKIRSITDFLEWIKSLIFTPSIEKDLGVLSGRTYLKHNPSYNFHDYRLKGPPCNSVAPERHGLVW